MRTGKRRWSFSGEWQNCRVGLYGNNNKREVKSLREKINEHSVSHRTELAEDILKRQDEEALESSFLKTQAKISDHPALIKLQMTNAVNVFLVFTQMSHVQIYI